MRRLAPSAFFTTAAATFLVAPAKSRAQEAVKADDPPAKTQVRQDETPRSYPLPDEIVMSADHGVPLTYPGGRDVIEKETLDTYPSADFATVLRRVPGVYVLPETGNDSRANFGIRGNDPRRSGLTTLLVDGVPICEAPYGNTDVDGMPVSFERIWRIDVIRGGASIRYGPNSAGGLINFVTEPIPDAPMLRLGARYGSYGDFSTSAAGGGTWGDFGALASTVVKGGDGYRENGDYTDYDGSLKLKYALSDQETLSWSSSAFHEYAEQPGGLSQADYDLDPSQSTREGAYFRYGQMLNVVQFMHENSRESAFQLIGWWQNGSRYLFDYRPVLAPYTVERVQDSAFSSGALEARYTAPAEIFGLKNSFYVSARILIERNDEYYWTRPLAGGPQTPQLNDSFHGQTFALFGEDTIACTDWLDWALGGRVETISMTGANHDSGDTIAKNYSVFLPESTLTAKLTRDSALYASYQENFYAPQYETGFDPASVLFAPTKPQYSRTYELGTRTREWQGLDLQAALFQTDFRNQINFINTSAGIKVPVNAGEVRSRGVETGLSYAFGSLFRELDGLSLYASYTEMRSRILTGPDEGNDTPDAPHRLASWGAEYVHASGCWARVGGSYSAQAYKDTANTVAGTPDGTNGVVPSATLWDVAIGWRQHPDNSGLSVSAGITNLLDEEYFRRFSTGIYPGAPRQLYVAASYTMLF